MCGIAGMVDTRGRTVEASLVRRLCDALVHRGPDDEGYYVNGPVALGQRRLAILDKLGNLSTGGFGFFRRDRSGKSCLDDAPRYVPRNFVSHKIGLSYNTLRTKLS